MFKKVWSLVLVLALAMVALPAAAEPAFASTAFIIVMHTSRNLHASERGSVTTAAKYAALNGGNSTSALPFAFFEVQFSLYFLSARAARSLFRE